MTIVPRVLLFTYGDVFERGARTAGELAARIACLEHRPLTTSRAGADGSA